MFKLAVFASLMDIHFAVLKAMALIF